MAKRRSIPLPGGWKSHVRSGVLQVISLARFAMIFTRSWAADSGNARLRLRAETERLTQELALLREELRIKDARLARIPAARRPPYPPTERLAILQLKTARGWSLAQAAKTFLLTPQTIADWLGRLDEEGPASLV